jgi:pyridoxal 5'-phosphate synthase pdxS subunit
VFVGSGIFKSSDPARRASAIVRAVAAWEDPAELLRLSEDLGEAMPGIELGTLAESERLASRGW